MILYLDHILHSFLLTDLLKRKVTKHQFAVQFKVIQVFSCINIEWIQHECAERHHELKCDSEYSEAHERAQSRYDGYPWENKF